jgi:exopolyphosphatase/guanosine-5'-triphosphate,3'-diphosphate pyrophosphatase
MFHTTSAIEKNQKEMMRQHKLSPLRLAIIDLGTNSVRLDVYRISRKGIVRTFRGKTMIRLGDGVFQTGQLSTEGRARALRAFLKFKKQLKQMRVDRVVAFGTSALRTASNAKDFIETVKQKTGICVKVISGREEGQLIAKGIMSNIEIPKGRYALVDIGGGSTEISICLGQRVLHCQSFRLGANRLQQNYFKEIPPRQRKGHLHPVLALRQELKSEFVALADLSRKHPVKTVIGSSGTIRTIAKILKALGRGDQPVHRFDLSGLVSEMLTMTRDQLKRVPGLEPKRVDLILSGSILLEEILIAMNVSRLNITDLALRDGILQHELEGLPRHLKLNG